MDLFLEFCARRECPLIDRATEESLKGSLGTFRLMLELDQMMPLI